MAVQRVTADVIDQLLGPHAVPGLSDIHLVIEFVAFAVLLRRVLQYADAFIMVIDVPTQSKN